MMPPVFALVAARLHRSLALLWVRVPCLNTDTKKKNPSEWMGFLFGGDYGTRTCDLMRVKHAL